MTTFVPQLAKRGRGTAATLKHFAERLKTVPGQWSEYPFGFRTPSAATQTVRNIMRGTAAFPAGQYEAKREDKYLDRVRVLVRFVGAAD